MDIYTIALCAGYGGLEIGLAAACEFVGWQSRVACYVERESYAAALIARRMEAGALDSAPIWSDLNTFDAAGWRGAVDCITAGFPCQPHSHAGRRKGTDDERWIWPDIRRIVRESGAWLVVLENVAGLLSSGGFDAVLRDLAEMGFAAEWLVLSASAVGASHRRERIFIVAYAAWIRSGERPGWKRIFDSSSSVGHAEYSAARNGNTGEVGSTPTESRSGLLRVVDTGGALANADGAGQRTAGRTQRVDGLANTGQSRCERRELGIARDGARGGGQKHMNQLANFAVHSSHQDQPTSAGLPSSPPARGSRRRLNPAFVGWLMGLPPLWTNIEHTSCDAQAMALYRSRLQRQLSNFFGASGSPLETPADAA